MNRLRKIIKREFEEASDEDVVSVRFTEDEKIIVETEHDTYTMQILSDDEEFVFVSECGSETVRFDYPADWS